jgi:hypothetical protein
MSVGVRLRGPLRDVYYEDCPPARAQRLTTRAEFMERIAGPADPDGPGEFLARAALRWIAEDTPYPKRVAIREFLPPHLRPLWPRPRRRGARRRSGTTTRPGHGHLRLVSESRRARSA